MSSVNWIALREFVTDFVRFSPRRLAGAAVLVVLGTIVEGGGLILVIPILNLAAANPEPSGLTSGVDHLLMLAGARSVAQKITVVLAVASLLLVVRALLVAWRQVALTSLQMDYLTERQIGLIQSLGAAPWSRVSRLRHSRITHLLSNDVYRIGQAAMGLLQCAMAIVVLSIQFAIALTLDFGLTLVALGLLAGAAVLGAGLLRGAGRLGDFVMDANLALLNDAGQFLGAMKLAMSQNLQRAFVDDFSRVLKDVAREEVAFVKTQNRLRFRMTTLAIVVGAGTAAVGFGVLSVPVATLVGLLVVLSRIGGPVAQLQGQAVELVRSLPAFVHLRTLQGELAATDASQGPTPAPPFGDILFSNVTYQHTATGNGATGVRNFNLTIPEGGFLGIAGPSGAGKTTFADLLVGLASPQAGEIRVGGVRVDLERSSGWRDQLAYVSQDAFLKHDSVRANLLWANPGATEEAIQNALMISGADDIVARLPEGLETVVGERGTLISGGERQRLAVARALLRSRRLLILDEATNAIDVIGERKLLARLDAQRPGLTIVMIAHRTESLAFCQRVAIVRSGQVAAEGAMEDVREMLAVVEEEAVMNSTATQGE